jgi:hypothetical protein
VPGPDLERDAVEHHERAELLAHAIGGEDRGVRHYWNDV